MIKRYKLKNGVTHEFLLANGCKEGGAWIDGNAVFYISKPLVNEISLNIGFPNDLGKWNDCYYVLVLDENFGQPYTPLFYNYAQTRIRGGKPFKLLSRVIAAYNKTMDSLPFFEELPPKKLADFLM